MQQNLPQRDPTLSTLDVLRQEAIAVHARLEALQALMKRQRAISMARQRESVALLDCRVMQVDTEAHGNP